MSNAGLFPSGQQMDRLIGAVEAIANGSGGSEIKSQIEYGIRFALDENGNMASPPAGQRVTRYGGVISERDITFTPNVGDGTAVTEYNDDPFQLIDLFSTQIVTDALGNVFRRYKPFWVAEQKMGGYLYIWICETQVYNFYRMPECFVRNINGTKVLGYRDIGKYEAGEEIVNDVTLLCSKPNKIPSHNHNFSQFYGMAQAVNTALNVNTNEVIYDLTHSSDYTGILWPTKRIKWGTNASQSIYSGVNAFNWTYINTGMPVAAYTEETMTVYFTENQLTQFRVGAMVSINASTNNDYYFKIIANGTATGTVDGTTFTPDDSGETYYYVQLDGTAFPAVPTTINLRPLMTGETDVIDAFTGTLANDGRHSFLDDGIENCYGNMWTQIQDVRLYNGVPQQLKDPYSFTEFSTSTYTECYNSANYTVASSEGWATQMGYDEALPDVRLTTEVGGSSSTYYCDYFWENTSGAMTCYLGGDLGAGSNAGLFCWHVGSGLSYSYFNCGARLSRWVALQGD